MNPSQNNSDKAQTPVQPEPTLHYQPVVIQPQTVSAPEPIPTPTPEPIAIPTPLSAGTATVTPPPTTITPLVSADTASTSEVPVAAPVAAASEPVINSSPVAPLVATPTPSGPVVGDAASHGPVVGQFAAPASTSGGSRFARLRGMPKKKLYMFGGIGAAALIILIGYIFAFYIPNQPGSVWKTGLNRSGDAVNTLVDNATEKETLQAFEKSELNLSLDATAGESAYSGNVAMKFDSTKANGALNISSKTTGDANKVFTAKFLSELKDTSQYPSVYLQFTGLKDYGLDSFIPALASYEGKWIAIDGSFLQTIGVAPSDVSDTQKKQISSEDIAEGAKAVASVTSDYVLTSDPQKAVLVQKKYIGKEKVDGIAAYHYKVGINKQHAADYCKAMVDTVVTTAIYKKYASADDATSFTKECQDSAQNDIKDSDTFDMWIDAHYKLIHKIRLADETSPDTYTDIGQNYKGGDDLSLFVRYHDGKSVANFTIDTNLKTHITAGGLTFDNSDSDYPLNLKATFEAKPYTGEIDVTAPAGAVPIQEILSKLGIDPTIAGFEDTDSLDSMTLPPYNLN